MGFNILCILPTLLFFINYIFKILYFQHLNLKFKLKMLKEISEAIGYLKLRFYAMM